jgi:hypothetical protein
MSLTEETEKNRILRQKRLLIILIVVLLLNIVTATVAIINLIN